ncbi:Ribonucleoside-diphosphate reductase large subunit [Myotis davidii]|uniref:Ribonucleoside-diphosphate reductase large subunit n=1 Tax=Myotis davidii TaxID=225400 RepID=L5LUC1_MYODS|nr:Ribonucleoside-diphosphate reductase large subunit [Myotis davidii]
MHVIKRDGRQERVMFDKITSRIQKLCYGLNMDFVDPILNTGEIGVGTSQAAAWERDKQPTLRSWVPAAGVVARERDKPHVACPVVLGTSGLGCGLEKGQATCPVVLCTCCYDLGEAACPWSPEVVVSPGIRVPLPEAASTWSQELRSTLWPRKYFTIVAAVRVSTRAASGVQSPGARGGQAGARRTPARHQLCHCPTAPHQHLPP